MLSVPKEDRDLIIYTTHHNEIAGGLKNLADTKIRDKVGTNGKLEIIINK